MAALVGWLHRAAHLIYYLDKGRDTMAERALQICYHPGCVLTIAYGERYCDKHKILHNELESKDKAARDKVYDETRRNKRSSAFYHTTRWKKTRAAYIRRHPLCEICQRQSIITAATEVHHIIELADGGAALEYDNLMALCHSCHMEITETNRRKRTDGNWGAGKNSRTLKSATALGLPRMRAQNLD